MNNYKIYFEDGQSVIVKSNSILTATQEAIEIKSNTPELYDTGKIQVILSKEL